VRLDKFLQLSRLVRRRTLANSLCHAGRVTVNGRPASPALLVHAGDLLTVEHGARRVRARVRFIPATRTANEESVDILEEQTLE
jgi:ribosomal 50S subunit-recycling heat shock protein